MQIAMSCLFIFAKTHKKHRSMAAKQVLKKYEVYYESSNTLYPIINPLKVQNIGVWIEPEINSHNSHILH